MMRKRAGARLRLDTPIRARKSPNWEQVATAKEKEMVKMGLTMVGLPEAPKLSEKGNQLMVRAIQINRTKNPQQQRDKMKTLFNQTVTELVNNSGYFAVKYKIQADPMSRKVKMTEIAGIAGGFTKTRNSMQGLLRT